MSVLHPSADGRLDERVVTKEGGYRKGSDACVLGIVAVTSLLRRFYVGEFFYSRDTRGYLVLDIDLFEVLNICTLIFLSTPLII